MDMILSKFYKEIKDRLKNANIGIEYIDIWTDQLTREENDDDNFHINFPAVFIEYLPIEWQTLGRRKQIGTLNFNVYVANENIHETSSIESDTEIDAGLEHLQLIDNVFALLQGHSNEGYGAISRTGFSYENDARWTEQIVHVMSFKTTLIDTAAMIPSETASPELETNVEYIDNNNTGT